MSLFDGESIVVRTSKIQFDIASDKELKILFDSMSYLNANLPSTLCKVEYDGNHV